MDINLIGPLNQLGYGIVSFNILKNLSLTNKVVFYPIYPICNEIKQDFIIDAIARQCDPNLWANCIKISPFEDLYSFVGKGKHIGFPIFELDKLNDAEKNAEKHCDKIFVCTEWAKNIVLENTSNISVDVINLGVDSNIFKPVPSMASDKTIFLNCGKWERRKSQDVLVECFNYAFEKTDNVELWLICDNPFINDNSSWKKQCKFSRLGEKIKIFNRQNSQFDIFNLMSLVDCGVFPSRAEGWNMELLEMMSCGKQVIATNYSGHTEFCNNENCMLINIDELEPANDGIFFKGFGRWAAIKENQKSQLIHYMRLVHKDKKTNFAGIQTSKKYSWDKTAEAIIKHL